MRQEELIKLAEELCKRNYCNGFDAYVECYGSTEWEEFLERYQVTTEAELVTALNDDAGIHDDYASNIETWSECQTCIDAREYRCECGYDDKRIQTFKPIEAI
jgi:hypothetical protein